MRNQITCTIYLCITHRSPLRGSKTRDGKNMSFYRKKNGSCTSQMPTSCPGHNNNVHTSHADTLWTLVEPAAVTIPAASSGITIVLATTIIKVVLRVVIPAHLAVIVGKIVLWILLFRVSLLVLVRLGILVLICSPLPLAALALLVSVADRLDPCCPLFSPARSPSPRRSLGAPP